MSGPHYLRGYDLDLALITYHVYLHDQKKYIQYLVRCVHGLVEPAKFLSAIKRNNKTLMDLTDFIYRLHKTIDESPEKAI